MLGMVDVEFIKLRARDGWSIRETARRTGWSRQAIRKALAAPAAPPRYELAAPRPAPVMGPYLPLVRQWLADDESAPPKQRHTARRIYDRLERWKDKALAGLDAGLKEREGDPLQSQLDAAMRRIGELSMENELLHSRIERPGPLGGRRSKR